MGERRILINALSWSLGGGQTYVLNLLRELNRDSRGFRFAILAARGRLSPAQAGGLEVVEVRLPGARLAQVPCRVLYEELALPRLARGFDLLYCPADLAPPFGATPTVVALRNLNVYDHRFYDTLRLRALERLVRLGLPRARRVVFPSRAAADLIGGLLGLGPERAAVVPHGISADLFEPVTPPTAAQAPYVFLPAPLERHKNVGAAIESLRHVSDPKLELWVAGHHTTDPPHARELTDRVERLGLGARVRFLGSVPYREILAYYRGAVALVLPSLLETFGHPLLEAMLAGVPIAASDIPAFREISGDVALYFDPRDPPALAAAVERIRSEPAAARARVERGRARAAGFSWKTSVDRLCAVFDDALRAA